MKRRDAVPWIVGSATAVVAILVAYRLGSAWITATAATSAAAIEASGDAALADARWSGASGLVSGISGGVGTALLALFGL